MASDMATRRLRKELLAMKKNPVDNIVAAPLESNILEWHYVITGAKGSPYEGGYYHGKLKFPVEYPMKPPSVMMMTPNGRFQCSRRLCLSMSDFHPESWNPMWSVSTILMGLHSFMLETTSTLGSVNSTTAQKRKFASESLEFNCKNVAFRKLFPELVELHERRRKEAAAGAAAGTALSASSDTGIRSRATKAKGAERGAEGAPKNAGISVGGREVARGGGGRGEGGGRDACGWVVTAGVVVGLMGAAYAWSHQA